MPISISCFRWAIVGLYSVVSFCIHGQTQTIHNTLKDINACHGRITLTLVREWGGESPEGDAQVFYQPMDIEIGQGGRVYVADSGNNRIVVFDSLGYYQRTIGKKGQAPGEFFALFSHWTITTMFTALIIVHPFWKNTRRPGNLC